MSFFQTCVCLFIIFKCLERVLLCCIYIAITASLFLIDASLLSRVLYIRCFVSSHLFFVVAKASRGWRFALKLLWSNRPLATGYLLPWDQLAFWGVKVGTEIAKLAPGGELIRGVLLGDTDVGSEALIRFYVLHVAVLPAVMGFLIAVHFFRCLLYTSPSPRD